MAYKKDAHWWGLAWAYVVLGLTFRGPKQQFWNRMTAVGLTLGSIALASEDDLRKFKVTPRDFVIGISSAGVLYGVFLVGNKLARVILPAGAQEIGSIYNLSTLGQKIDLGARLAFIIGPAEELFWRSLVQKRLMEQYGPLKGMLLGTAAYSSAHLVAGNLTLIGAAAVAGLFWGGMYAMGVPLSALIISHSLWDVFTFLVAPIAEPLSAQSDE